MEMAFNAKTTEGGVVDGVALGCSWGPRNMLEESGQPEKKVAMARVIGWLDHQRETTRRGEERGAHSPRHAPPPFPHPPAPRLYGKERPANAEVVVAVEEEVERYCTVVR